MIRLEQKDIEWATQSETSGLTTKVRGFECVSTDKLREVLQDLQNRANQRQELATNCSPSLFVLSMKDLIELLSERFGVLGLK